MNECSKQKDDIPQSGYVFRIDIVAGGYVYFTTFTKFCKFADEGRESRTPDIIRTKTMMRALEELGQHFCFIDNDTQMQLWLAKKGWAIVSKEYCEKNMKSWLKDRLCLKTPAETYSAIEISSKISQTRLNSRKDERLRKEANELKKTVYEKHGRACMQCKKTEQEDDIKITLHHIRPFSKGGETTIQNLIPLCEKCNRDIDNDFLPELYDKIGVIYGYDMSLLEGKLDIKTWNWLVRISDNLMHTRSKLI